MNLKFSIPIIPRAQARARSTYNHKIGRVVVYPDKKQRQAEENLCALLLPYRPETPLDGPLVLTVFAYMPIARSWPKKRQDDAVHGRERPTGIPDLDNLVKHVKDCMTNVGFWRDDKQVVRLMAAKHYSLCPCWYIELEHERPYPNGITIKEACNE